MEFPSPQELKELEKKNLLNKADNYLAQAFLNEKPLEQEKFVVKYLSSSSIQSLDILRKAVFHAIFNTKTIRNIDNETVFQIIRTYGYQNIHKCVQFLNSCRRSIPAKMTVFLLNKLKQGMPMDNMELEKFCIVLFSSKNIMNQLNADNLSKKLVDLKPPKEYTWQRESVLTVFNIYAEDGPINILRQIFPDLMPFTCHALLEVTSFDIELLTTKLLDSSAADVLRESDNSSAVQNMSINTNSSNIHSSQIADDREALRKKEEKQKEAKRRYWMEESEEPELEEAVTDQTNKSSADKKLDEEQQFIWAAFNSDPSVFSREKRKSPERKQLKQNLNWSDEQIEGWARVVGSKSKPESATINYSARSPAVINKKNTKSINTSNSANKEQQKEKPKSKAKEKKDRERNEKWRDGRRKEDRRRKEAKQIVQPE
mgnify:CR=1 FL=1